MAILSRILPPTPVDAPGKGDIPVGKLWVSALYEKWIKLSLRINLLLETTKEVVYSPLIADALSWKDIREFPSGFRVVLSLFIRLGSSISMPL